ncbi:tetratricopeptide repeat protein [Butyrivibrio fibrisolvens]|uniref:tetratricopeptide repeat protein n=1 Tax=Butyrivibrio fibrisolvens TaxID=831 RepID=UPI0004825E69|nr:tetratricopeptide repeat protein [Butyrivibrio fibrisolvens]
MTNAEEMFMKGNLKEAFNIFLSLAQQGDGRAMYFLALYYALGLGDIDFPDDVLAGKLLSKGAEAGDLLARLNTAYFFNPQSHEFTATIKELFDSIKALADSGDIYAQNEMADLYMNGWGTAKDLEKGLSLLKGCSEKGLWLSSYRLAQYYDSLETGEGQKESMFWLHKAAEQGCEKAEVVIKVMELLED